MSTRSLSPDSLTLCGVLNDVEMETTIMALAHGRAGRGFTQGEAARAVEWAACARVDAALLADDLSRDVSIDLNGAGDFVFTAKGAAA